MPSVDPVLGQPHLSPTWHSGPTAAALAVPSASTVWLPGVSVSPQEAVPGFAPGDAHVVIHALKWLLPIVSWPGPGHLPVHCLVSSVLPALGLERSRGSVPTAEWRNKCSSVCAGGCVCTCVDTRDRTGQGL